MNTRTVHISKITLFASAASIAFALACFGASGIAYANEEPSAEAATEVAQVSLPENTGAQEAIEVTGDTTPAVTDTVTEPEGSSSETDASSDEADSGVDEGVIEDVVDDSETTDEEVSDDSEDTSAADPSVDGDVDAEDATVADVVDEKTDTVKTEDEADVSTQAIPDGWYTNDGKKYYYLNGSPVTGWQSISGETYYFDLAGGQMHTGELNLDDRWYYLDPTSGTRQLGWTTLVQDSWTRQVYYDLNQGWMLYGEHFLPENNTSSNYFWFLLHQFDGSVQYGWHYLEDNQKWVFYSREAGDGAPAGAMLYGEHYLPGDNTPNAAYNWYYFDQWTGKVQYGWMVLPYNPADMSAGARWVYYGPDGGDGIMRHGEAFASCNNVGGEFFWYYFNPDGSPWYGWLDNKDLLPKVVLYDMVTGGMIHGWYNIDGQWKWLNRWTGEETRITNSTYDAWLRIRGAHGRTNVYVCVNKSTFRTMIFQWDGVDWAPVNDFICGLGRLDVNEGRGTFSGHWYMGENGQNGSTYPPRIDDDTHAFVRYRYSFTMDMGFHSTVYNSRLSESEQVGRYISDGCVRLYMHEAEWFYYFVPMHTDVLIYW